MIIKTTCNKYLVWGIRSHLFNMEIKLKGNGIVEDPNILYAKSQEHENWYVLHIIDSHKPLIVEALRLRALYLRDCTNVTVSDITVKYLGLENSSQISIEDAYVNKIFWFENIKLITVSNSEIKRLFPTLDQNIKFTNCEIKKPTRKSEAILRV